MVLNESNGIKRKFAGLAWLRERKSITVWVVLFLSLNLLLVMEPLIQLVEWMLPVGTLTWFDVTSSVGDTTELHVVLTEKNNPPLTPELNGKKIASKGFKDITVTDFPVREKRLTLTFRRRYWQVEGQTELLKRDIQLCAPGTQLSIEFGAFLKEDGGRKSGLSEFYRRVSQDFTS